MRRACVLLAIVAACGGEILRAGKSSDDGGRPSEASTVDGSTAKDGPPDGEYCHEAPAGYVCGCPVEAPQASETCPAAALQCEYGDSLSLACDQMFVCDPVKGWTFVSATSPCVSGLCPGDLIDLAGPCSTPGLGCSGGGAWCQCDRAPAESDLAYQWYCGPIDYRCPALRPRLGSDCGMDDPLCDYGACYGGIAVACQGPFWQERTIDCPDGGTSP